MALIKCGGSQPINIIGNAAATSDNVSVFDVNSTGAVGTNTVTDGRFTVERTNLSPDIYVTSTVACKVLYALSDSSTATDKLITGELSIPANTKTLLGQSFNKYSTILFIN